jgi:pyruvate,water dikinase
MFIIPFPSPDATLEKTGGKGANLARLTRAGFDVPRGFIVSTDAYREYVKANALGHAIQEAMKGLIAEDADALAKASQTIRSAFSQGVLPSDIQREIQTAYTELNPLSSFFLLSGFITS